MAAVSDDDLERAWRQAAQCLQERGFDAAAEPRPQEFGGGWGIVVTGDTDDQAVDECSEEANKVSRQHARERIPEGEDRLALARSLQACLGAIGIVDVPYDPDNPDERPVLASAVEQLGYQSGQPGLTKDPRFAEVLLCLAQHELLFPSRFREPD